MLPIASPFDTFRAGLWALWQNAGLALGAVALMAWFDPSVLDRSTVDGVPGPTPGIASSFIIYAVQIFVQAVLIFAFHATFLSDGRIRSFAAVREIEALFFVGLRMVMIAFAAVIPFVFVSHFTEEILFEPVAQLAPVLPGDDAENLFVGITLATLYLAFGVFVILLRLRIPEIVEKREGGATFGSVRRGLRQFRRMALNLAAGPGLFICVFYAVWWGLVFSPVAEPVRGSGDRGAIAVSVIYAAVFVISAAMTAGVLSDAYRRSLAREGLA